MPNPDGSATIFEQMVAAGIPAPLAAGLAAEADAKGAYNSAMLDETRKDREQRLTIANNQLKAQREQLKVTKGQAEADRWYKEQQVKLAQGEAQFQRDKLGIDTGMGLLGLRAGLKGPGDWAQFLDVADGYATLQPQSAFLSTLAQGKQPGVSGVAFGGSPTPSTLGGLASGTTGDQRARANADLALAARIAANPGKVAQGQLGTLNQDQTDYLLGLAGQGGYSARSFLDAVDRSGIGQGNPWAY